MNVKLGAEGIIGLLIQNADRIELKINGKISDTNNLCLSDMISISDSCSTRMRYLKQLVFNVKYTGYGYINIIDKYNRELVNIKAGSLMAGNTVNLTGDLLRIVDNY